MLGTENESASKKYQLWLILALFLMKNDDKPSKR